MPAQDEPEGTGPLALDVPQTRRKHAANTPQAAATPFGTGLSEMAMTALEAGALVPVRVIEDEPGKFGYPSPVKWGVDGPPSAEEWRRRWQEWRPRPGHGVAVHLGKSGLALVDLDLKNGHDGIQSYVQNVGQIPDTLSETTPSGGLHLYFVAPQAMASIGGNQATGLWDGVDVKWGNQIAVCAPTERPDGEYITITDAVEPEVLPAKMVGAVAERLAAPSVVGRPITEIITKGSDRGSRDNDLTRLMFWLLHQHGSGDAGAEKILKEALDWNERNCRPPLPDDVVRRKLVRLFSKRKEIGEWTVATSVIDPWEITYVAVKRGEETPTGIRMSCRRSTGRVEMLDVTSLGFYWGKQWAYLGSQMGLKVNSSYYRNRQAREWFNEALGQRGQCPITVPELVRVITAVMEMLSDDTGRKDRRINGDDLSMADLPEESWLIDGLVMRSVINMLVGNGGVGKTTLALAMAQAWACGVESSEDDAIVPEGQGSVYYYTAEDDWEQLAPRFRVLTMGRSMLNLVVIDSIIDEWDLFNRIRENEGDTARNNFRVIDSISAVFGNLNDNEKVVSFMRGLRLVGGTSELLAHQSKGSMATGRGDPMGAVQWRNQARHVVHLSYDEEDKTILNLMVEKHNGSLAEVGSVKSLKRNVDWGKSLWYSQAFERSNRSILLSGIRIGHRRKPDLYQWAKDQGISSGTASKEVSRMVSLGVLVEQNRMLYTAKERDGMRLLGVDE